MPDATTAQEVIDRFSVSERALQTLRHWNDERPEVATYVLGHTTRVPYSMSEAELRQVMVSTEHALGDVKKADVEDVAQVRDWSPRFALTHVLHYALESLARPFTYQEFRAFCKDDALARSMLWSPAAALIQKVGAGTIGNQLARDSMRWRVGNAYYSFLRELVVVTGLRARGLDLEVHPLADALFRVDAWVGSTVLLLYIGNARYRDGETGRKPRTQELLGPSFRCVTIGMATQHQFGRLHVPNEAAMDDAADRIQEVLHG